MPCSQSQRPVLVVRGERRPASPRTRAGHTLAPMAELRVLDTFAPSDAAAVRALADVVEDATGEPPFGEITWDGLAGRGILGDRGLLLPGSDSSAVAYLHLAHHQQDEWSLELAALPDATDALPRMLATARDVVAGA